MQRNNGAFFTIWATINYSRDFFFIKTNCNKKKDSHNKTNIKKKLTIVFL